MALAAGDKFGPYEILSALGSGGLGEVYKARDTRLDRIVAIKVSNSVFSERLEREARAVTALHHPHICQLYEVGPNYLVMEYVEGVPLRGPLPLDQALKYAAQICDALYTAHKRGITHGNLKPANLLVTKAGVKLLDFGLVEQTDGQDAGPKSDVFGLGLVLHEILADVAPPSLHRVLQRCLEKDPENRWHSARDLNAALELVTHAERAFGRLHTKLAWAIATAVALTLALAAFAIVRYRQKPPVKEVLRFEIPPPTNATFGNNSDLALSPDGSKIAFIATGPNRKQMIWVQSLHTEEARPLAGTEDAGITLIWSPDSRYLAFQSGGTLKKIEASGGLAQTLCDAASVIGGVWTSDNRILFGGAEHLQIVPAAGGMPTPLTTVDHARNEVQHEGPAMLPDGHHFLYSRASLPLEDGGVYIGSLDAKPERQSAMKLLPDATRAVYMPSPLTGDSPGFLLFVRGVTLSSPDGTLMARPFDPKRMEFPSRPGSNNAVPVADQVYAFGGFSASPSGVLAFGSFSTAGTQANSQLTWFDRKGDILSTAGDAGEYGNLALSPDQARVAYRREDDLWLLDFAHDSTPARFTSGNPAGYPAWSPEGNSIVFTSMRGDGYGIYRKASNLAGPEELLFQSPNPKGVPSWTSDGRFLIYDSLSSDGKGGDLWLLPVSGSAADRNPMAFLSTQYNEHNGRFSPDVHWVAYSSNRSGNYEIYVQPFDAANPGSPPAAAPHQASKGGGDNAHWSGDGKELFYMAPDDYLVSVAVSVEGSAFQTGMPQRLFKKPMGSWDVTADGQRFLVANPPASGAVAASRPYRVIENWTGLLKR
jgi:eukaryotic-like serine/threonine-protein kinase